MQFILETEQDINVFNNNLKFQVITFQYKLTNVREIGALPCDSFSLTFCNTPQYAAKPPLFPHELSELLSTPTLY